MSQPPTPRGGSGPLFLVAPHPDDDVLGAGGLLALEVARSRSIEVVYVTEGRGVLESSMGELEYRPGDYVVIPRGILHRFRPAGPSRFFIIESAGMVTPATPSW